jgi:hypothetical protein
LGITLIVFAIIDNDKKGMIEKKTGYSVPSEFKIEKFVKYGSLFKRTGFEAKIRIDTADHLEETIVTLQGMLGDDYHEISLADYNIEKYSLFSGTKLVPEPVEISWVIVGPAKSGTLVCFLDIEHDETEDHVFYMYMYYND